MRLRYIDRLHTLSPRVEASAHKCVSFEEAMLARPSLARGVPGTLLVEWIGQLAALLVAESTDYRSLAVLGSLGACRFGPPLLAGEVARLVVRVRSWGDDSAYLDGEIATDDGRKRLEVERAVVAFVPSAHLSPEEELRAAVRAARGHFPGPVGWR